MPVDITSNTFYKCTATFRTHCISVLCCSSWPETVTQTSVIMSTEFEDSCPLGFDAVSFDELFWAFLKVSGSPTILYL